MPELPEVETTRRGIAPHVVGKTIERLIVREPRLRWPVDPGLPAMVAERRIDSISRRGKYLLFNIGTGSLIVHLGMSGNLRIVDAEQPAGTHDHVDWRLDDGTCLRFSDPRRFGSLLFASAPLEHRLLRALGPEPLGDGFSGDYLYDCCRGRRTAIKQLIMNARIVVGVGNIYANEALFRARIHPFRAAGRVSRERTEHLVAAIRAVLCDAIEQGGTTLRDFVGGDGRPGYFSQSLCVYDRAGLACAECGRAVRRRVQGQRATYYCVDCQR